jgi:hypothetical protein
VAGASASSQDDASARRDGEEHGHVVEVDREGGGQAPGVGQRHAAAAQLAGGLPGQLVDEGGGGDHRGERALASAAVDLVRVDAGDGGERRRGCEPRELVGAGSALGGPGRERRLDLGVRGDPVVVDVREEGRGGAACRVGDVVRGERVLSRADRDRVADGGQGDAADGGALCGRDGEDRERRPVELLEGPGDRVGGEERVREVEEVRDARGVDAAVADELGQRRVVQRAQAGREHQGVGHGRPASGTCRPCDAGDGR